MGVLPHDIGGEPNFLAELYRQRAGNRRERELRIRLPLRAAQVSGQDYLRTALDEGLDGGQGRGDAAGIGNLPVLIQRDVEVRADEDVAALHTFSQEFIDGPESHSFSFNGSKLKYRVH